MAWIPASGYRHCLGWKGRVCSSVHCRVTRVRSLPFHAQQHAPDLEQSERSATEVQGAALPGNELQLQPNDSCQEVTVQDATSQQTTDAGSLSPIMQTWRKFRGPRFKRRNERPEFLNNYPVPEKAAFNINSMLGPLDIHAGKYYVPPDQYPKFLSQYFQAYQQGYQLYLTERYGSQPFRYFLELDFDWGTDEQLVKDAFFRLYRLIKRVLQEFYKLQKQPMLMVSMRTPWKVHLNAPFIVTTEPQATVCRDKIIQKCREELAAYSSHIDWERVIDFPHGSFRLLGSLKRSDMTDDPPWVTTKNYHPVIWSTAHGEWQPVQLTHDILLKCSITPTAQQRTKFENSEEYLNIIFEDVQLHQQKALERRARRLVFIEAELQSMRSTSGTVIARITETLDEHGKSLVDSAEQSKQAQTSQPQTNAHRITDGHIQPAADTNTAEQNFEQPQTVQQVGMNQGGRKPETVQQILTRIGKEKALLKQQQKQLLSILAKKAGTKGEEYLKTTQDLDHLQLRIKSMQIRWFALNDAKRLAQSQQQPFDEDKHSESLRLQNEMKELQRQASALMRQQAAYQQELLEAAADSVPEHLRAALASMKNAALESMKKPKNKKGALQRQKDGVISSNEHCSQSVATGTSLPPASPQQLQQQQQQESQQSQ